MSTAPLHSVGASVYVRIASTGGFLPARRLSNQDLVAQLARQGIESSDEWIVERTGIKARHFADETDQCSDLALRAAQAALANAGCAADEIDLIIVATSTPDMVFPSTACIVQRKLGASGGAAFDVQAACSGFIYALTVADAMIRSGSAHKALVIGAEVFSRLLDFADRSTCVLFGDGAGAVLLEAAPEPGILASELHADGRYADILFTPGAVSGGQLQGVPFLKMDGQAVFKQAVNVLEKVARSVLQKAARSAQEVDWLIPHQANIRIMQGTLKKLGLPSHKLIATVAEHGNTSAASIPLALNDAVQRGQVQRGQTLLLEAVGGGLTWGAILVDF
jgi:3-oxoacyl-[acyl-carrier-protein] synthase III